ncbi:hypothetical protein FF38_06973 [Lucilia cuprina]|uniref:Uncharacterized protein n=1 Tax=Lucilia cuprina TaxID=7375 RepID=A0A0L0CH12_LUCCU|nr:hypothetical protein FF38_06973 [Lucilia cuprina]
MLFTSILYPQRRTTQGSSPVSREGGTVTNKVSSKKIKLTYVLTTIVSTSLECRQAPVFANASVILFPLTLAFPNTQMDPTQFAQFMEAQKQLIAQLAGAQGGAVHNSAIVNAALFQNFDAFDLSKESFKYYLQRF